jgi:vesicle transport protein SEC22
MCSVHRIASQTFADQFIQKTKKLYMDANSQRNMSKIASELADAQRIMTRNIEDILGRGERMTSTASTIP